MKLTELKCIECVNCVNNEKKIVFWFILSFGEAMAAAAAVIVVVTASTVPTMAAKGLTHTIMLFLKKLIKSNMFESVSGHVQDTRCVRMPPIIAIICNHNGIIISVIRRNFVLWQRSSFSWHSLCFRIHSQLATFGHAVQHMCTCGMYVFVYNNSIFIYIYVLFTVHAFQISNLFWCIL